MTHTVANAPDVKQIFEVPLESTGLDKIEQELQVLLATIVSDNQHRPADQRIESVTIKVVVAFPEGVFRDLVLPD